PNTTSEFSKDNPYISNSAEDTKKSNDSAVPESTSTFPANLNQPSSKLFEENSVQNNQENNLEIQEQIITEPSSSTSSKAVNENPNTEQDSDSIEINADSNSKEESFTIAISKKSRKMTKKRDQSYPKSTGSLRKRDLSSDNEMKGKRHQEY
ncbi:9618_t:CDS:1, partial [Scutellospora calospora]